MLEVMGSVLGLTVKRIFIGVAILIKLEDPKGPVIFTQDEVTGVGDHATIASGVKLITHDGGHESSGIK